MLMTNLMLATFSRRFALATVLESRPLTWGEQAEWSCLALVLKAWALAVTPSC
jgi:hypothetical protein